MFAAYSQLSTWIAIIAGGVIGCFGIGYIAHITTKAPLSVLATNPGKQLWSVIYMIPVPFLIAVGGSPIGFLLALIWLTVMPSIGVLTVFKPSRPLTNAQLFSGNGVFAVIALVAYGIVAALIG